MVKLIDLSGVDLSELPSVVREVALSWQGRPVGEYLAMKVRRGREKLKELREMDAPTIVIDARDKSTKEWERKLAELILAEGI
tara:strand:+ start:329 stop:577 length:249 start_codon:yes stop_codon:yes gene_type:complete